MELATVVFQAFRERYHKVAGGALGLDGSEETSEFRQRLSMEELNRASFPCEPLCERAPATVRDLQSLCS